MTFMSFADAQAACAFEAEQAEEARQDMKDAYDQLQAARAALESERSIWDGSTFGSIGGGLGIIVTVAGCLAPDVTVSKGICAAGIAGGALGVGASEMDRHSDIANAEAAVEQAELVYDMAVREATRADLKYGACLWHHISKPGGGP